MTLRYARYALMNALLVFNLVCLTRGGWWLGAGFAFALVLATLVDEAAGDDLAAPGTAPERLLEAMLVLTLPLVALNSLLLAHYVTSGDPLGVVAALGTLGIDFAGARAGTNTMGLVSGIVALGLYLGAAAINVAHELVHRTEKSWALSVGRWLLAFSCDTTFAIEHVYGHHRTVCTDADPATARRGEYVMTFAWRSFVDGNGSAFAFEAERLKRKGLPVWSWHNCALTWQAATLAIAAVWGLIAGWTGVLVFLLCAIQGKLYLEAVNYIEHYGLVRVPGTRVEPRHSWNCYRSISSGLLYNLPRHAHHHRYARKPFWQLEVEPGGPVLPFGYMTSILATFVPPVWRMIINPRLETWDRTMASAGERKLLAERGQLIG